MRKKNRKEKWRVTFRGVLLPVVLGIMCFCFFTVSVQAIDSIQTLRQKQDKAIQLAREGNYDKALPMLEALRKEYPYNRNILYDHAVVLSWAEKYDRVLELAESLDLDRAPVHVGRAVGLAARRKKQFDKAIDLYRRLHQRQPQDLAIKIGLAFSLAESGKPREGLPLLQKELETQPNNIELLFALSHIHNIRDDAQAELACYDKILEIDPLNEKALEEKIGVEVYVYTDEGDFEKALVHLEKIIEKYPDKKKFFNDYVMVLSWDEQDEKVARHAPRFNPETAPLDLLAAIATSYRRLGKTGKAIHLLKKILERDPGNLDARVGHGLCLAQEEKLPEAMAIWKKAQAEHPDDIGLLLALAYAYHLKEEYYEEMRHYRKVLDLEPDNKTAKLAYMTLISMLGAPNVALEMVKEEKQWEVSTEALETMWADRATQYIKWGQMVPLDETQRFAFTDQALELLQQNAERNKTGRDPYNKRLLNRTYFDRLVALRDRDMLDETIKEYNILKKEKKKIPYYALIAVADAYVALKKPGSAVKLYEEALKVQPHNFNARMGLFYAYLESERYRKSLNTIDALARDEPKWFRVKNAPIWGKNSHKVSADLTSHMSRTYGRRLKRGMKPLAKMRMAAPFHGDTRAEIAKVWMRIGWPRKAIREFRLILANHRSSFPGRIWSTYTLMELNRYKEIDRRIEALDKIYPEHREVRKLKRDWETRHRWYYHSEMIAGRGKGTVIGTRDFSIDQYLYAPPINHWFKFYLHHRSQTARFLEGSLKYSRVGAGIAYERGDIGGNVELTRDYFEKAGEWGLILNSYWNINDYWRVSAGYNSNTVEIPFKGKLVELEGRSIGANVRYRPDDSRNVTGSLQIYKYNDDNVRRIMGLNIFQRLYIGPYLQVALQGSLYMSTNSRLDRVYYNPEKDFSYGFALDVWQHIYRRYYFKFVHRVILEYGSYWQKGYGAGGTWILRYEHHWDLDDRRAFLYGISRSQQRYDGKPEGAWIYYATIKWRF